MKGNKKMAKNTRGKQKKTENKGKHQRVVQDNSLLYAVICFAVAILLFLFFFVDSSAVVNKMFKQNLLGLFGVPAILIPFILVGLGVYFAKSRNSQKAGRKLILSFLTLSVISAFVHLSEEDVSGLGQAFSSAYALTIMSSHGGGFFGACIALPLYSLMHKAAAYIILSGILLTLVSFISECSVIGLLAGIVKGLYQIFRDSVNDIDNSKSVEKGCEMTKNVVKRRKNKMSTSDILSEIKDVDITKNQVGIDEIDTITNEGRITAGDESMKSLKKKSREIIDKADRAKDEGFKNNIDDVFREMYDDGLTEKRDTSWAEDLDTPKNQVQDEKKKEKKLTEFEKAEISEEIDKNNEKEIKEYVFPPIDLLNPPKTGSTDSRDEMYKTANKLISVLENFGVKAKLLQVTPGPSVTRYEILPSTGVKLSKIVGLADDLALNLAVSTVLVAPVPGKAAVGIEIPNKETASVTAREILESDEFKVSKSKLTIALGKDIGGRVVVGNIAKMPHLLIAGATGSGKSVCINTIITSLLYKASPDEVKLIMVDPKVVELGMYNGIPHLLIPVVTEAKKAAGALNWAVTEMMHRYDVFAENFVKNLEGYNQLMEKTGGEKMPQIVIIIDELADLMMVAAKEVEDYICRLAQLARAAGIHLIVATQRPTVDVITGLIKANIPSRIAFAVASQIDSRTIIDRGGADKLLGRGDMLYVPQGARSPIRVQGAFVSDDEIERLIEFLKDGNEDSNYSEDLAEHIERIAIGDNGVTPDEEDDGDELLPQAIELAVELGQISTAMIQRRLKVGYSRAGRIIDQMEARGIISGANGSKPRQVYINHSDLAGVSRYDEEE